MDDARQADKVTQLSATISALTALVQKLESALHKSKSELAEKEVQMDALADAVVRMTLYHDSIHDVMDGSVQLLHEGKLDELYRFILANATELTRSRFGMIGIFNDSGTLERLVSHRVPREIEESLAHLPVGTPLLKEYIAAAETFSAANMEFFKALPGTLPGTLPRYLMGVPLQLESGITRAVMYLACREDQTGYTDHDDLIMDMFAMEISHLLEREELLWLLRDRNDELAHEKQAQSVLIEKLQQTQTQLLQSEKLAAIGQMAAGIAHEINNPIGFVYSNLGSLEKYIQNVFSVLAAYETAEQALQGNEAALAMIQEWKKKADLEFLKEDIYSLVSESREGVNRVKRIVQDLRDFSRLDATDEWQFANLRACLDSTLNIAWNEIKYKAEVKKEYGDIPDVECLPSQLNQVFMNLLVNAAQAIEDKGTITIRTSGDDHEVQVEIADTGKGIPAEIIDRIFDPFFTTKPIGKGTGLGLSVSYGIIRKHGGTITVKSEPGTGTTFSIVLPVKRRATEQGA